MAPRDLDDYPGPDDPPLENAPDATPAQRRRARTWARRTLTETQDGRPGSPGAQIGLPPRWAHPVDTATSVVFIAQLDTGGASWQPVLDRLACGNPTVVYDRPGTGTAPPRPAPNPPVPYSVFADELAAHLDTDGADRPVVLVGHSVGSLIARVFAGRHPGRVAGMVHVDGSLARFHLVVGSSNPPVLDGGTVIDTLAGEAEVVSARVPKVPTAVVSRTPGWYDSQLPHSAIDDLWTSYQQHLATGGARAHIVARSAGHDLPAEAPALVAYAVDMVVSAGQQNTPVMFDRDVVAELGGDLGYGSSMR